MALLLVSVVLYIHDYWACHHLSQFMLPHVVCTGAQFYAVRGTTVRSSPFWIVPDETGRYIYIVLSVLA